MCFGSKQQQKQQQQQQKYCLGEHFFQKHKKSYRPQTYYIILHYIIFIKLHYIILLLETCYNVLVNVY